MTTSSNGQIVLILDMKGAARRPRETRGASRRVLLAHLELPGPGRVTGATMSAGPA